jgi:WD40 repeat protein
VADDSNRCSVCGKEQSAGTSTRLCAKCQEDLSAQKHSSGLAKLDTTSSFVGEVPSRTPEGTPTDSEGAGQSKPNANAAKDDCTVELTPPGNDSTETADGYPTSVDRRPGTFVRYFGDYEIQKELGRGGMGFVYQARQVSLNRLVALKMIKVGVLADEDELRRFQNEAEAVALLDHPGIVPVYEVGDHEGQRYFSMKLIEGGNLSQNLARFTSDPKTAVPLLIGIAQAMKHAHMRGILHRDLKPANILLDHEGNPHITDFGLAKRIESDIDLTQSGAILGTPSYMSPEQAQGRRTAITTATDVYGLGAIFYAMLTGKGPFAGDSVLATLDAVRTSPPEPPTKLNPKIPRDLELICLKCLEKDPGDRYPSSGALAEDLARFELGEPVSVRAAGIVERVAKWARRKPTLGAAYSLGLLALILGGVGGVTFRQWRSAVTARDGEVLARFTAEKAQKGEETARAAAEKALVGEATARQAADRLRQTVERIEYGRTMEVCYQEYREDNIAATVALLNRTSPQYRGWEYRYLDRLCHFELKKLTGHASSVTSAVYSPDGSRILTTSRDATAKLLDSSTGAELATFKGSRGWVCGGAFTADGSRIVTAWEDGTAKIWDAKTGAEVLSVRTQPNVWAVAFSPDGSRFVTGSYTTIQVCNAINGAETLQIKAHTTAVRSISFSRDGSRIVTGGEDKMAKVWDAKTGAELLKFGGHSGGVLSTTFSPDDSQILSASWDRTTRVWDSRTGAEIRTLRSPALQDTAAFSADGTRIVSGGGNMATVWDAKSGAEIFTLKGHISDVTSVCFSPDGSRILTGSMDNTSKIWDARTPPEWLAFQGQTLNELAASFSPDGTKVLTASFDRTAKLWDAKTGVLLLTLQGHTQPLRAAWFSPDGERIVTGSADKSVRLWDAKTGAPILALRILNDGFVSPFSPDGSRVVTGGWEQKSVAGSNPNLRMSFGTNDMTARVCDTRTGNETLKLTGHKAPVYAATFSHDGSRIATASTNGEVRIWDAKTGAVIVGFSGSNFQITAIAFSPDDSQMITSYGNAVRVWNAKTGEEIVKLNGHTNWISSAEYSPDSQRIVTASHDGTIKLWDTQSGAEVLTLKVSKARVDSARFSPDGSRIVSSGGGVRIWDATPINRKSPPSKSPPVAPNSK